MRASVGRVSNPRTQKRCLLEDTPDGFYAASCVRGGRAGFCSPYLVAEGSARCYLYLMTDVPLNT